MRCHFFKHISIQEIGEETYPAYKYVVTSSDSRWTQNLEKWRPRMAVNYGTTTDLFMSTSMNVIDINVAVSTSPYSGGGEKNKTFLRTVQYV